MVRGQQTISVAVLTGQELPLGHVVAQAWPAHLYPVSKPTASWMKKRKQKRAQKRQRQSEKSKEKRKQKAEQEKKKQEARVACREEQRTRKIAKRAEVKEKQAEGRKLGAEDLRQTLLAEADQRGKGPAQRDAISGLEGVPLGQPQSQHRTPTSRFNRLRLRARCFNPTRRKPKSGRSVQSLSSVCVGVA